MSAPRKYRASEVYDVMVWDGTDQSMVDIVDWLRANGHVYVVASVETSDLAGSDRCVTLASASIERRYSHRLREGDAVFVYGAKSVSVSSGALALEYEEVPE